ncbi:uncharacterized protein LOC126983952 isoform X1 [Eriocheir sinensis]|uniref:uncharacterized protein LOC126983952 isoform X1 n=1 Tax=Eriocheir sinensis TaxID=95602 RepID=UPI0021C74817|nr:uncharacterized protein LOC126983952 isoform X1 [Eriocheir sinensis]
MTMHWTIRTLLLAVFFASLAWAAEVHKNAKEVEVIEASPKEEALNTDISGPEQKVISVGNVGQDATKVAVAASVVLTGIWCGVMLLIAEFIRGIGARIYPVIEGQGDEEVFDDELNLVLVGRSAARRRPARTISILEWAFRGIESINSRLHEEERDKCRKLTLCMLGSVTSGYSLAQSFFQVIRPAVPLLDNNWEGLVAGQAREDCNVMYERCPIGILSSFFRPNPPAANATTTTTTTSTPSTTSTTTTPLPRRTSTLPPP